MNDPNRWREFITTAAYESLGHAMAGLAMTGFLLLIWGIGRRRGLEAERNERS
jgi:hypothetical protein